MNDVTLKHATADDGARIAYALHEAGPHLPRLVFLHSLGMDHSLWSWVVERLVGRARLLCLDMRGHGLSDRKVPYGAERHARDLRDVMDHVGWADALVVGASLGGCVALQFAAHHGHRVRALGLVDTTAWYGPDAELHWNARARRARDEGLQAMVPFQETRWFSDAFRVTRPDVVERCVRTFLGSDVRAFAAMSEMLGRFDARDLLHLIRVPTSIVVGEEDYATPVAMAQVIQHGIAGARLAVIPVARHFPQVERPDAVASMLLQLMAKVYESASDPFPGPPVRPASDVEERPGEACP